MEMRISKATLISRGLQVLPNRNGPEAFSRYTGERRIVSSRCILIQRFLLFFAFLAYSKELHRVPFRCSVWSAVDRTLQGILTK